MYSVKKLKGFLIFIAILVYINIIVWGLISILEEEPSTKLGNDSFNAKQYQDAAKYYEKAIFDSEITGSLLVKLGYSLEKTSGDKELINTCYRTAVYLFESNSGTDKKEYKVALSKLKEFGLLNDASEKDIDTIKNILRIENNMTFFDEIGTFGIVFLLLIGFTVYILGLTVASKTNCVIVYGKIDALLLFIPCIAFFALSKVSSSIVAIIFFVWFIISIIFSIIGNHLGTKNLIKRFFYIFLSIITKIVLVFLLPAEVGVARSNRVSLKVKRLICG